MLSVASLVIQSTATDEHDKVKAENDLQRQSRISDRLIGVLA